MGLDLILFIMGQVGLVILAIFLISMVITGVLVIWLTSWRLLNG